MSYLNRLSGARVRENKKRGKYTTLLSLVRILKKVRKKIIRSITERISKITTAFSISTPRKTHLYLTQTVNGFKHSHDSQGVPVCRKLGQLFFLPLWYIYTHIPLLSLIPRFISIFHKWIIFQCIWITNQATGGNFQAEEAAKLINWLLLTHPIFYVLYWLYLRFPGSETVSICISLPVERVK